jgi:mono/diheme cytochrome c family protein
MKRVQIFVLAAVVVIGLLIAAGVSILHDGLSSMAKPSALETAIARTARKMAAPSGTHNAKNPVADSPEVQREARLHFADHCAICHGNDGSGDTMIGHGLYPKPPDLRASETQSLSDGDIFWIIQNGVRLTGMPAFSANADHGDSEHASDHGKAGQDGDHGVADSEHHGGEHVDAEASWKLVHFIRHLPQLTQAERLEMEKYNPKGPDDREEEKQEDDFLNGPAKPAAKGKSDHR